MKRIILLIIAISGLMLIADTTITRGPDVGEIYFIAPTRTCSAAIYRSTDFGETATCMDSTLDINMFFNSIVADMTSGVLYANYMDYLYISYNYGEEGSWIFRNSNVAHLQSGRTEGCIYSGRAKHSDDYGNSFIYHLCQGTFGNYKASEIDNSMEIAYYLVRESNVLDSMWLLISFDNYENLEIHHTFSFIANYNQLSRGYEEGELFFHTYYEYNGGEGSNLRYSNDFGETWELKNTFNCPYLPITGIVGGRQPGEIYMLVQYVQNLHSIVYIYIYHSLDYGETFTIYPILEYGPEPYFANFSTTPDSGSAPLTVQFTDTSSGGGNLNWQWDFNDDGLVDSYEQNPVFTYQYSGTYRVKLEILEGMDKPELIARKSIYVTDGSENDNAEIENNEVFITQNYPNPFNPITTISYELPENIDNPAIEIFDLRGQRISSLKIQNSKFKISSAVWDGSGFASGIYFYRLNIENSPIKKMILLK